MGRMSRLSVLSVMAAGLVSAAAGYAGIPQQDQDQQNQQTKADQKKAAKEAKKKEHDLYKELDSSYRKWLDEDVVYIISPEERSAFLHLTTNEERESFIENFWQRRNPDPDSPENTFKEEHYRRIAYANEHYASGIPGWKTDRGRIYIMWGAPDETDSHPSGGTYERPPEEGGGETTTYPFEDWRYRYLEGIGENVIIEFVDPSGSGEYHLTMDPSEKDALTYVPGAGLTMLEQMGLSSKTDRFNNTDGTHLGAPLGHATGKLQRVFAARSLREDSASAAGEVQRPGSNRSRRGWCKRPGEIRLRASTSCESLRTPCWCRSPCRFRCGR